ncbi:MAG: hypothetical protein HKP48_07875 [Winogradskyella sp.]|uniref:hypothetical protein n=1 Tax=Winogradskyella sp. TaxID=1883156 RepID=UPI00182582D7|nr:hypothetical protein [Winogradskyella sp.]MBT8245740.1 hypothetical protein [Winogradskyella sp.]NNK23199.1 hypothetical protein [Winogradskyella sp.]
METQVIFNTDLHFEHVQWNRELSFWEDELKSFNKRLEELVVRWTDKEVLANLEHYQNEFILQDKRIDELQEAIQVHETRIAALSKAKKDALDTQTVKKHFEFRNKMETQRQIYADLKKEFFRFLSKYM